MGLKCTSNFHFEVCAIISKNHSNTIDYKIGITIFRFVIENKDKMAKNVLSFLGLTATVEIVTTKIEVFVMARGGSFMKTFFDQSFCSAGKI